MEQLDMGFGSPSYYAPLSYVGGKKKLYWIISQYLVSELPDKMVSPFMGGASLELRLAASGTKVITGDIFEPYVEFMQLWQVRSDEIIRRTLEIYPMPKEDFRRYTEGREWHAVKCPIDRAAITWSINKMSFMAKGFSGRTPVGLDFVPPTSVFLQEPLQNWKNDNITFLLQDYRKTLDDHPDVLAYLDPPYYKKEDFYGYGDQGTFDHQELKDRLDARQKFVMSYGDHPVITELYKDYRILRPQWKYFGGAKGRPSEELLILSHDIEMGGHPNVESACGQTEEGVSLGLY